MLGAFGEAGGQHPALARIERLDQGRSAFVPPAAASVIAATATAPPIPAAKLELDDGSLLTASIEKTAQVIMPMRGGAAGGAPASRNTGADDLELEPLVPDEEEAPPRKKDTALWVGLGVLGAAALGGLAVALMRAGK